VEVPDMAEPLTFKDFQSDQAVRWCPGCGDYTILGTFLRMLPKIGVPKEKVVVVSGIGCSSRFPYYIDTYGFHTIHGRAFPVATGLKIANPDLSVWVVTGDGDGLSIGAGHLIHALRRNVDVNILLFNNRIYGLTKGQYSPTSEQGKVTKSSPLGSIEQPINALCNAIAAEATFIARSVDSDIKHLMATMLRAHEHKGTSFIEIFQNCKVFNNGAYEPFAGKLVRSDKLLYLNHGKPMLFGKERDQGIVLENGITPTIRQIERIEQVEDVLVHDESMDDPTQAYLLTQMNHPELPVPVGVFRCVEHPTYELQVAEQISQAREKKGAGDIQDLIRGQDTWTVEGDE